MGSSISKKKKKKKKTFQMYNLKKKLPNFLKDLSGWLKVPDLNLSGSTFY